MFVDTEPFAKCQNTLRNRDCIVRNGIRCSVLCTDRTKFRYTLIISAPDTTKFRYTLIIRAPDTTKFRYKLVSAPDTTKFRYTLISAPDTIKFRYTLIISAPDTTKFRYTLVSAPDTTKFRYTLSAPDTTKFRYTLIIYAPDTTKFRYMPIISAPDRTKFRHMPIISAPNKLPQASDFYLGVTGLESRPVPEYSFYPVLLQSRFCLRRCQQYECGYDSQVPVSPTDRAVRVSHRHQTEHFNGTKRWRLTWRSYMHV